jgi:hypothetical protein
MNSSPPLANGSGNSGPLRLLRRSEAAEYVRETFGIPLSYRTLAKLAVVGGGPLFRKAGRFPLYEIADLDSWVNARLGPKQCSTSDDAGQLKRHHGGSNEIAGADVTASTAVWGPRGQRRGQV